MSNSPARRARKRFGQNFLQDESVIDAIIEVVSPDRGQHFVEIGPGRGALTLPLIQRCDQLDVVEVDRDLIALLKNKLGGFKQLHIHEADVLQFDFNSLLKADEKIRLIGNLPYNISTPLLFHLIEQVDCIEDMCFMLQKEVVERICAQPGSKTYGRLSIMIQYHFFTEQLFTVPPQAFDPRPRVDSAIIYLQPFRVVGQRQQADIRQLNRLVTQAFSQRRKTIANTLKNIVTESDLLLADIDPRQRPETVSVEQYVRLAEHVADAG